MTDDLVTSDDLDRMVAELTAAGWTPKSAHIWRSPAGFLFLGPAGAWREMRGIVGVRTRRDLENGRRALVDRSMKLRVEIEQIFTDCASWNDYARKPGEDLIDPDPDGQLRRIADGLDRTLEAEAQR